MKIAIDNIVSYNPNKFIANTRELLQEWPDSDPNIYLYDLIDIKNHKESQLNSLEHNVNWEFPLHIGSFQTITGHLFETIVH